MSGRLCLTMTRSLAPKPRIRNSRPRDVLVRDLDDLGGDSDDGDLG